MALISRSRTKRTKRTKAGWWISIGQEGDPTVWLNEAPDSMSHGAGICIGTGPNHNVAITNAVAFMEEVIEWLESRDLPQDWTTNGRNHR